MERCVAPLLLALVLGSPALFAGPALPSFEQETAKEVLAPPPPEPSKFQLILRAPLWLPTVEGESGVRDVAGPVNLHADELIEHLDWIATGEVEFRYGRWGLGVWGQATKLSGGLVVDDSDLVRQVNQEQTQIMVEPTLSFRIWEGPKGFFDVYAGGRYNYLSLNVGLLENGQGIEDASEDFSQSAVDRMAERLREGLDERVQGFKTFAGEVGLKNQFVEAVAGSEALQARLGELQERLIELRDAGVIGEGRLRERAKDRVERARKKLAKTIEKRIKSELPDHVGGDLEFMDPIVGFRARYYLTEQLFAQVKADVGGFGVNSDLTWQAIGTLGWQLNEHLSSEVGWKQLEWEYEQGGTTFDMQYGGFFSQITWRVW